MKRITLVLAAVSAGALAVVSLSGCSAVDALLSKSVVTSYADASALGASGDAPAAVDWMPADAGRIELRRAIDAEAPDGVLTFTADALHPDACAQVERRSAPAWGLDDTPDVYAIDSVWACGEWSVVPDGDDWLAWTPNSELERADAATALGR
jgi:hypothetical protein